MSSTLWTPWTIVHKDGPDKGKPVLPMDCAEDIRYPADEALLVFRTREAAELGAKHQQAWNVDCEPKLLLEVIVAEAAGQEPTPDGMIRPEEIQPGSSIANKLKVRADIYTAQGFGTAGSIGPDPVGDRDQT